MEAPPVHYVTARDGKSIAYAVCGEGEPLVFVPALFGHINLGWDLYRSWFEGFAEHFHFVHYDGRGTGYSSRHLDSSHDMQDWQSDLEDVLDAGGIESGVLFAGCHAGHIAVRFALAHPERVRALILNTVSVEQKAWGAAFWTVASHENWGFFLHSITPQTAAMEDRRRLADAIGESMSPDDMNASTRAMFSSSLDGELQQLQTPTLVLHTRVFPMLPAAEGAKVAAMIPHSRFVLIDGDFLYGDGAQGIAAVRDFLSSLPPEGGEASPGDGGLPHGLSQREVEVLRLVAAGRSNQQIADALVISLNTVRRHVSNVFAKTGVANRTEAAGYARDHGIA